MYEQEQDPDIILVTSAQEGSKAAIAELCTRFTPLIHKYAYAAHVRTVAEDIKSDLWIIFLEAIQSYNPTSGVPVPAYFKSKITFALWNRFKAYRNLWNREVFVISEGNSHSTSEEEAKYFTDDFHLEQHVINNAGIEALLIAIKTLTPEEQQLIYHYYIQEKSLLVLATQKGITKQAYSYRHRKILEKLRQVLEPNIQG